MPHAFDPGVVTAVIGHMNQDHSADSLLIARAFGPFEDIVTATMAGFDGSGGDWIAYQADGAAQPVRVPWPEGPISERPDVRRQIVALYEAACERLGVPPRPHP